jgi:hypothetical protein
MLSLFLPLKLALKVRIDFPLPSKATPENGFTPIMTILCISCIEFMKKKAKTANNHRLSQLRNDQ